MGLPGSLSADAGTRRQAFYNDLDQAAYLFRVIAGNNEDADRGRRVRGSFRSRRRIVHRLFSAPERIPAVLGCDDANPTRLP